MAATLTPTHIILQTQGPSISVISLSHSLDVLLVFLSSTARALLLLRKNEREPPIAVELLFFRRREYPISGATCPHEPKSSIPLHTKRPSRYSAASHDVAAASFPLSLSG